MNKGQKDYWWSVGFHMARGAIFQICVILIVASLLGQAYNYVFPHRDDCDAADGTLCGMRVYTDARTNLQYLGNTSGITPRLGADGKQIGATH